MELILPPPARWMDLGANERVYPGQFIDDLCCDLYIRSLYYANYIGGRGVTYAIFTA